MLHLDATELQRNLEWAIESLILYRDNKAHPGGFLAAVLSNDLRGSFGRADEYSNANMFQIVKWCYNNLPIGVWGSKEIVEEHLKREKIIIASDENLEHE
jgi:hypothetical protein